jgi:hypothetical protein
MSIRRQKRPNFFIVGGRKCGTTSLYALLKRHPEIHMPKDKEPHFFGSDIHARPTSTMDRYLAMFSRAEDQKRIGEASTGYLYSRLAAKEIKQFSPDARIIAMVRNPIEAVYSLHSEYVFSRAESIVDFEAALEAEGRRKQESYLPPPAAPLEFLYYRDCVKYTEQIRRYFDAFGRENVRVIILDDLQADTPGVLRETLSFLDVQTGFTTDLRVRNPNKLVRNETLQDYLLNPSRGFAHNARKLPGNALIRSLVWLNTKKGSRPSMSPDLRRRLLAEFAPEVERLSALLDRDLTHWSRG